MWYIVGIFIAFVIFGLLFGGGSGSSGGHGCLAAGNQVLTSYGSVNVESLKKGDLIKSFDYETGNQVEGKILEVQVGSQPVIHEFHLANGARLDTSPTQRVRVNGLWIRAKNLKVGMRIGHSEIIRLSTRQGPEPVYTFVLEPIDNFIVRCGDEDIVCHDNSTP